MDHAWYRHPPDDDPRRVPLMLPRPVLALRDGVAHWVDFDFADLPPSTDAAPAAGRVAAGLSVH